MKLNELNTSRQRNNQGSSLIATSLAASLVLFELG